MPHPHTKKLDRIPTAIAASILTLAGKTSIAAGTMTANTQDFAAALYQGIINARGGTVGETLALYVADGDLAQAEVEEAIESVPTHERATTQLEQTRRNVQLLGQVGIEQPLHLDTGNRLAMFKEDIGARFWAYNPAAAAMTTGMVLGGQIWLYGWWKN